MSLQSKAHAWCLGYSVSARILSCAAPVQGNQQGEDSRCYNTTQVLFLDDLAASVVTLQSCKRVKDSRSLSFVYDRNTPAMQVGVRTGFSPVLNKRRGKPFQRFRRGIAFVASLVRTFCTNRYDTRRRSGELKGGGN